MEREIEVLGFRWTAANEAKIMAHGLTISIVNEVLETAPRFYANFAGRSAPYIMIGPDKIGRFCYVPMIPTEEPGIWEPITGYRVSSQRARKIYDG